MPNKNHKLAAIVFTDIVGYTRQMEEDEQRTMQLLQKQREIIFPLVKEYEGEVIKEIGDGLMMMFNSSVDAVRFAIKMQQALNGEELTIRAGIHMGDVIFKDGDIFGSAVNTAARIEPLAEPNGICISENVKQQLGNKDIRMISQGRKELKGVNRPIEIFEVFIEGVSQERKITAATVIKDIWGRYVIQIAAGYLIAAWIIKMAVSSIVVKNFLSPHIVELTWIILISLMPTVIIISYFHGKRERNKWHKAELIGLPANILLSILLVFFMFNGEDLGAATEAITVKNEKGDNVERYVVKSEFRKKVCIYNFTNISNDTTLDWQQYMVAPLIEYDLSQDIFIRPKSAIKFSQKLSGAGFPDGLDLPVSIMKKFARYYHLGFFMSGTFDITDGQFIFKTKLYETKNGKLISERVFEGANLFVIIDDITVKVKEDMGVPMAHIEEVVDLPIDEIFTNSTVSLEHFSLAERELMFGNYESATKHYESAIEEDPGFAFGYVSLAQTYLNSNQVEKGRNALGKAMQYIDKVPERLQFRIKIINFIINAEPEKAMSVIKMWVELYPEDIEGHKTLAQRHLNSNNIEGAIAEYKTILRLDPEQYDYLPKIGKLYQELENQDSALRYFHLYAKEFPKDYKSYYNIGEYYEKIADFENAKKYYEKAYVLEPSNVNVSSKLAKIEFDQGNFESAFEGYNKVLGISKTAKDSAEAFSYLSSYFQAKGQMVKSVEAFEKTQALRKKFMAPIQIIFNRCFMVSKYIEANETEKIFGFLDKSAKELNPPLDGVISFGYLFAYLELEDDKNAEKQIPIAVEVTKVFGESKLLANIDFAWARIYEMREDFDKSIEYYDLFFESLPTAHWVRNDVCRVYRKMEDYDKAEKNILIALKHAPYSGVRNYEASLLYYEMGEKDKAFEYLKTANEIWKDADPGYKEANEAKAKLAEMEMGS